MADDQQTPQITPIPATVEVPAVQVPLSFLDKLNAPVSTLWSEYKGFLIIFGILVLIIKFREAIIQLLVASSRQAVTDATKQDTQLKSEENQANDQANQLRQDAEQLSQNKPEVTADWNKK